MKTDFFTEDAVQSTEGQRLIAETIRRFGEKEILPHRTRWDEQQEFPIALFKAMGQLGLMGILVPEKYGGSGLTYSEYIKAIAEIARLDGAVGLSTAAHNSLCIGHILNFGNESQKQQYLPPLASGEWIGAWALTEPNTGSDAGNMHTVAIKDGDHYVINGTKNFITHGLSGNVVVVMARTGERRDSRGITAFIVEKGAAGFSAGKKENKMGMRASETSEIIFSDCRVHKNCIVGTVGEGLVQALKVLEGGRISIAALGVGIAQGAFEAALQYAQERHQFDKPIGSFQGVSFKIADMAVKINAAWLLTSQAAALKNEGKETNKESAMAKLFASETAVEVSGEAVQIFGGYGYMKDFPVEKYYRDAKLCTIGEGTSEIQKLVISKALLK